MTGGRSHRLPRTVAFLAVWVAFGGIVLAGWLTQLRPSAASIEGFDAIYSNSLDNDTAITPETPVDANGNVDPEVLNGFKTTDGNSLGGQVDTGATTIGATNIPTGTNNGSSAVVDPKTGDVTVPNLTDDQKKKITDAGQAVPQQNLDGTYTLPPVAATAAGVKGLGTGVTGAQTIKLSNDPVAHPFGTELTTYIGNLYRWALIIGAGLAVMMIMWAGYTYVVSAGDPEAVRSAKDYLWGALLGLALLILTYTIFSVLKLGTNGVTTLTAPAPTSSGPAAKKTPGSSTKPGDSIAATDMTGTYALKITSENTTGYTTKTKLLGRGVTATISGDASSGFQLRVTGALQSTSIQGTQSGTTITFPSTTIGNATRTVSVSLDPSSSQLTLSIKFVLSNVGRTYEATAVGTKGSGSAQIDPGNDATAATDENGFPVAS